MLSARASRPHLRSLGEAFARSGRSSARILPASAPGPVRCPTAQGSTRGPVYSPARTPARSGVKAPANACACGSRRSLLRRPGQLGGRRGAAHGAGLKGPVDGLPGDAEQAGDLRDGVLAGRRTGPGRARAGPVSGSASGRLCAAGPAAARPSLVPSTISSRWTGRPRGGRRARRAAAACPTDEKRGRAAEHEGAMGTSQDLIMASTRPNFGRDRSLRTSS